ncbi:hypothetical protein VW23_006520 [Devosia insulae DS-56]|uniref:Uncharacterized protein n=1 Tax=Devosia insulae DS-56 TaxID=1116389 RepID=A0A1E5XHH6_9HYPH|nr:hypothetical protein [Devosia insulae]OEO28046.1 hypothetical protein VW23_006520 [Devosia insulae DS-56]
MNQDANGAELVEQWTLPFAARLGSSIRSKGLYLEIRARLPVAARKSLSLKAGELALRMPQTAAKQFAATSALVSRALEGIESLPVIPREIEDILGISTTERHRWLKDGRLPSAGTRSVKLRGRARKVTFHVFDPRVVEDILDHGLIDTWREDDAVTAAENRRNAAWKAKLTRARKTAREPAPRKPDGEPSAQVDEDRFKLRGWAEFERDTLLR